MKKTVNDAWGDDTGLLFPVNNMVRNRADWFSWLPNILIMKPPKGISGLPWQLWVILNHLAMTEQTCKYTLDGLGQILERKKPAVRRAIKTLVSTGMIAQPQLRRQQNGLYAPLTFDVGPGRGLLLRMQDQITAKKEGRNTDASEKEFRERAADASAVLNFFPN